MNAPAILETCDRCKGQRDRNHMSRQRNGENLCCACIDAHNTAWRAARKAQLAARPKDCDRCGARPHTYTYAQYRLCGRCLTATKREHFKACAKARALAIFATEPLVDTKNWRGARAVAHHQAKQEA